MRESDWQQMMGILHRLQGQAPRSCELVRSVVADVRPFIEGDPDLVARFDKLFEMSLWSDKAEAGSSSTASTSTPESAAPWRELI
jgi:hypothetical protein